MVQLSHPYVTTGKTKALTTQAFAGKVMSLLFKTLSRFKMDQIHLGLFQFGTQLMEGILLKGDCSLEEKAMTNLDSILKSRDITLSTKVHLVKAMVFPVVMYGCESWTISKLSTEELMLLNCGVGEDS